MSKKMTITGLLLVSAAAVSLMFNAPAQSAEDNPSLRTPGLEWATYFGGVDSEVGEALAVAPDGTVVIVGFTMAFVP